LIPFRKDFVFGTDFISEEEYLNLKDIEKVDYSSLRAQISCPSSTSEEILKTFNSINSMIIGIRVINRLEIEDINNRIEWFNTSFFLINMGEENKNNKYVGINHKNIDLSIEKRILKKVSDDTKKSIVRMSRVVSERIKRTKLDGDFLNTILDFTSEKVELQRNILKKEIQNFYSGCKRAFFILSRLDILNNLTSETKIGFNTLKETIDFPDASLNRILLFIKKEWGEDYSHLIENDKVINLSDKIQSLWG
jgi:hypothetical protein